MTDYENVLVLKTEYSDPQPALEHALALARATGAALTLLDIAEPTPAEARASIDAGTLQILETAALQRRTEELSALADEAARSGVSVTTKLVTGSPFRVAIQAVLRDRPTLIAKTIDNRDDRSRATLGSIDKHLLRKCPCPVWLIANSTAPVNGHIVAAVNPDQNDPEHNALSVDVLQAAATFAALYHAQLDVVHAWKAFGELLLRGPKPLVSDPDIDYIVGQALNRHGRYLDELVAELSSPSGVSLRTHLVHARPADAIIDFVTSNPTRLLVMGTVGRTGIPGLLIGNTAERILDEVICSVLTLKPRGFVSPITLDA